MPKGDTNLAVVTKEFLIQKYIELKRKINAIPSSREFCKFAGIHGRKLEEIYGDNPYTKFQEECGDEANRWKTERVPEQKIMRQYGDLALELGRLPVQANWIRKGFRPTISGLAAAPHLIKWSDFPLKFREWAEKENIVEYFEVLEWIRIAPVKKLPSAEKKNIEFENLIGDVGGWSPARRRNTEESYKVELRGYLKSIGYSVNEEYGESDVDLLVEKKYAMEIKKAPSLAEYDRRFGQIARHLQHGEFVVALIMDVPREDQFKNFSTLVDEYLNKGQKFVELIKK